MSKRTEEEKLNLSEKAKRRWRDPVYREKIVKAMKHPRPEMSNIMVSVWERRRVEDFENACKWIEEQGQSDLAY